MLELIVGRSGTGKSKMILERAAQSAREGNRVLLLVPEQFSFQTERKMLARLGGRCLLEISVLSFSRLCENIFRSAGQLAGKRLDDMARLVLMKLAVQESADMLALYERQSKRTDFLKTMLQTVEELKSCGVYPAQLRQTIDALAEGQLRAKLCDIAAVYEVYQGIVERSYQDPLDDITRAVQLVRGSNFFAGYHVYIDGFGFFSPPERALIEVMLEQCEQLTLALCCDGIAQGRETDLFADQKQAAHRFIRYCAQVNVPCKKPLLLAHNHRAQHPALLAVEQFAATGEQMLVEDGSAVAVLRYNDKYEEVRAAAAQITRMVREQGLRYRDIAVVCRNLADYETALESIFHAYAIPLFFDKKEQVTARPMMAVVCAALDAVRGEWKTEALLRLVRCPACGIPDVQAAQLENYAYIWSVAGKAWEQPFTGSPLGLERAADAAAKAALAGLEALRIQLVAPLQKLKKVLRSCTGSGFSLAIYQYLCDVNAANHLREFYAAQEDIAAIEETDTLYNTLIDILDLFADSMENTSLPATSFVEMFELALECVELGSIPNTNDQTIAGSADRIRLDSPAAVFVLGLNEGVFPARYQPHGVFSDTEREQLILHGVELSASRFQRALLERFFLYSALSSPTQRLYLSYAAASLGGAKLEPSLILGQLCGFLPGIVRSTGGEQAFFVADLFTAREQYLRGGQQPALRQALEQEGDTLFLELVQRLHAAAPAQGVTPATAQRLIGEKLNLSPSRIEDFYRCPYLYFCNSLLRLRPRRRVEYTPLEAGSAVHYVLEKLLLRYGGSGLVALDDTTLEQELAALLHSFIESVAEDTQALASRFRYQFARLVSVLVILVRHIGEDFAQSRFVPAGMEVGVGENEAVKPISFTVENGTRIAVIGKIDRVDIYEEDGERYARVVDYKSGGKDFRLDEVFFGLNMQMLLYLFAVCADKESRFGEVRPAGVLYMSGRVAPPEAPPGVDSALLRSLIGETLQMKGLLLEDEKVLRAMERELEGRYIPAKLTRTGTLAASSKVGSVQDFARLQQVVLSHVQQMGEALTQGRVEPLPARSKRLNPCDYCDYGGLCANCNTPLFRVVGKQEAGAEEVES